MRKSLVCFPLPLQTSKLIGGKMRWWHIVYTVGGFLLFYCTMFQKHRDQNLTVLCSPRCKSRTGLFCVEIAEVPLICRDCRRSVSCSCYSFAQEEVCSAGWPSLSGVQLNTVKPQQELGENLGLRFFLLASIIQYSHERTCIQTVLILFQIQENK